MDDAQWISSSERLPSWDSAWMVHSGYHPVKRPPPLRIVLRCAQWMHIVLLGYAWIQWIIKLKHRPLRIVLGWCTVDIILLNIVLLG